MDTLSARLTQQNELQGWIDCNQHGRSHRWVGSHRVSDRYWWRCLRCPVTTFTNGARPRDVLRPWERKLVPS